ncbi:MAG: M18 family aminopeptidase [Leucobacter sp.]|nr:M18 family aminopeptidase [Leucobacter sp.]
MLSDRDAYIDSFTEFIGESPTSYHAVSTIVQQLSALGYVEHVEADEWQQLQPQGRGFLRRDGAIIAWRAGAQIDAASPVRILGSHTDSPGLMLKPQPDFTSHGWAQAGVEVYGGPLVSTWFDRDLAIAGRIVTTDGREHLVKTAAVARVPMLAIHLNHELGHEVKVDRQRHLQPVIGMQGASVLSMLAQQAGVTEADIAGADVRFVDSQPAARIGATSELFAAPRLDNLSSVFAGLVALTETEPAAGTISMLAAFDHEELGSMSRSGAHGPLLSDVLARLRSGLGAGTEDVARAIANSWCLSADAGHSVHPNYAEKHDPHVQPLAGHGPMLKVNAQQRYASDAHGAALWRRCCEAAGVVTQSFVSNNTVPCGSTIGPMTSAKLGIRTVDVGVPLLSMHSARELAHVDDLHGLAAVTASFFAGA